MPNEDTLKKTFMTNLNHLLQKHDASQADLAAYMGVSNTTVNNWAKGYKMPRMDKIDKICLFFSIHRSDLLNPQINEPMDEQDHPHDGRHEGKTHAGRRADVRRAARDPREHPVHS